MEQPQQVEDEEYERAWERVAAIDVAKASGVVCTRVCCPALKMPTRAALVVPMWGVR